MDAVLSMVDPDRELLVNKGDDLDHIAKLTNTLLLLDCTIESSIGLESLKQRRSRCKVVMRIKVTEYECIIQKPRRHEQEKRKKEKRSKEKANTRKRDAMRQKQR